MSELKCNICGKCFDNYRKLNGHKSVHREGGRYSVQRSNMRLPPIPDCEHCGAKCKSRRSKFCSKKCFNDYRHYNIYLPKFNNTEVVSINSFGFRFVNRLLTERDGRKCSICQNDTWCNKPIPLDIDHKDGNHRNNAADNLRFLCPNCHRQTDTWGMKSGRRELKEEGIHGRRILGD